jgi:hypothetical protein
MNYGPLEFASYLERDASGIRGSAAVNAARAAAPAQSTRLNPLTVVAGDTSRIRMARAALLGGVGVYEAVATGAPGTADPDATADVRVRASHRGLVLVLSANHALRWRVALDPGATLNAVLVSGYGASTVTGTGDAIVASIGGFYAFRRGSAEFRHLESEVMRCTGRIIENFQRVFAGHSFDTGMGSDLSTAANEAATPGVR